MHSPLMNDTTPKDEMNSDLQIITASMNLLLLHADGAKNPHFSCQAHMLLK